MKMTPLRSTERVKGEGKRKEGWRDGVTELRYNVLLTLKGMERCV